MLLPVSFGDLEPRWKELLSIWLRTGIRGCVWPRSHEWRKRVGNLPASHGLVEMVSFLAWILSLFAE